MRLPTILSLLLAAFIVVTPYAYYQRQQRLLRGFGIVEPGVLYRSAQLPDAGLEKLMHDFRIRTVISLRDGESDADKKEEALCMAHGLNFHRLPPANWALDNGKYPIDVNLAKFRSIMSDSDNHPVLIHCFAGIHRTGSYCAIFRMDYNNWSKEQALHEMVQKGYTILKNHEDVQKYFNQYQPQPIVVRPKSAVSPALSAN